MKTLIKFLVLLVPIVSGQSTGAGLNKAAKAAGKLYFGTATDNPGMSHRPFCNPQSQYKLL